MKRKVIFILALLCAVAQGARAQWGGGDHTATEDESLGSINVSTATLTIQSGKTVRVYGSIVITGTLTVTGSGTLVKADAEQAAAIEEKLKNFNTNGNGYEVIGIGEPNAPAGAKRYGGYDE